MASEQDVIASIPSEVAKIRERYEKQRPSLAWRKEQLGQLRKLIVENQKQICEALNKDLGILPELANVNEVGATIQEIDLALANIDTWVKPEPKSIPLMMRPASASVHKEPFGVVLIISPWNYPFRLLTFPLVGAIAAGNAVVMKPSEVSAHTSALIKRLFDKYLCKSYIATFEGGVSVSSALLSQRFDYIFYTGNTEVGKIVMKAASENLTPVTLELGGKSPVIIDKTANLDVATNRILYGKFTNAGQTCVSPDYLLVEKSIKEPLIDMLKAKLKKWYTEDPQKSESYSRVINERHTARLQSYLDEVRNNIVLGGRADIPNRFLEPTIVDEPSVNSKLMKDEIFGPILPVIGVNNVKEAVQFVNSRHKPLALYVFSQDKATQDYVINNTSSGGVCLNATIFHIVCPEMEFGGVGHSGMGQYNGKHTFDTFSHRRAVLSKATWVDLKLLYPPYTPDKRKLLQNAAGGMKIPKGLILGTGAAVAAGAFYGLSKL